MMRKLIFILLTSILSVSLLAQNGRFSATGDYDEDEKVPSGFGLEKIYVFKNLSSSTISYETSSSHTVSVYSYQNSMSDRTEIIHPQSGKTMYTISNLPDSRGLLVNDNGQWRSVWIIDYNLHKPQIHSIRTEESDDRCEVLKLVIEKDDHLEFRGTGGQVGSINRKYDIIYQVQEWDDDNSVFVKKEHIEDNLNIGTELILDRIVPNMNTQFTIRGDQFGKKFGIVSESMSDEYQAVRVEAHIKAIQAPKNAQNEGQGEVKLGGSAPVDIEFFGYGNEPVVYYYTWFVYNTKDMENPVARYTDQNFDYTFQQAGNYEVVLEIANGESTCVTTEKVSFEISESDLDIPNFFSPGSSPGSHDEFKVYYKSLIKYHCVIFNRWGNKVFETRDPAQGWDGRYKGRLVNPGVYFYSIEATGSEGKKYKRGGDINILR